MLTNVTTAKPKTDTHIGRVCGKPSGLSTKESVKGSCFAGCVTHGCVTKEGGQGRIFGVVRPYAISW